MKPAENARRRDSAHPAGVFTMKGCGAPPKWVAGSADSALFEVWFESTSVVGRTNRSSQVR
jgi:hypothetical protein